MKKTLGLLLAVVLMSGFVTGCYNKCCGQPQPTCYKGEG